MQDEELQQPLVHGDESHGRTMTSDHLPSRGTTLLRRRDGIVMVLLFSLLLLAGPVLHHFSAISFRHKHHHGHVVYQATLKKNNQIEYAREFTAPCDYGVLVFNVGPAKDYLPYSYDIYQDAYVFSNNKKMCWLYPNYRAIQKGPFPWWVQGDPTSFDVPLGKKPQKISHRIVRPADAKNFTASKGGDFVIIGHHKFYTPSFYKSLKAKINSWTDDDDDGFDFGNFGSSLENTTLSYVGEEWEGAGKLQIAN